MNSSALNHSLAFMHSWLAFRYKQEDVPGFTVAIAHKGKLVFNESFGYANVANQTRLTPQHAFRIASHSKTFTATAIMQLQEKQKLRIDDYIVQYMPWLQGHVDTRWQRVTIRQLLSHGAGVIRDGLDANYWQLLRPFPDEQGLRKEILAANLVVDTNTKLKYSNFGYSLLGLLIEAVSKEPYNTYVMKHIVESLDLKSTGPEYTPAIDDKLATGYTRPDFNRTRLPIAQINTRAMSAATGFYATAEDLCTYFTAHMVGSGRLLSDESKREMQRVQWHAKSPNKHAHIDYGLGLDIEYMSKRRTIGHGGGFPGHITKSVADPKDELVIVVLTNYMGGPVQRMAKGICGVIDYFQQNALTTKPKHNLVKLEGRYTDPRALQTIPLSLRRGVSPVSPLEPVSSRCNCS